MASTWNRADGTPASSSAMAIEYGSSPVDDGTLSSLSGSVAAGSAPWRTTADSASNAPGSRKNQVSGTTIDSTSACSSSVDVSTRAQYARASVRPLAACRS